MEGVEGESGKEVAYLSVSSLVPPTRIYPSNESILIRLVYHVVVLLCGAKESDSVAVCGDLSQTAIISPFSVPQSCDEGRREADLNPSRQMIHSHLNLAYSLASLAINEKCLLVLFLPL